MIQEHHSSSGTSAAASAGVKKRALGWILGGGVGLLLSLGVLLPLWLNVDQHRPEVVRALEERIHGRVELGKLKLSLLGRIAVRVQGLRVLDSSGTEVLKVSDAAFHFPLWPLLSGRPVIQFEMNHPELHGVRSASGELNLIALFRRPDSNSPKSLSVPVPQTSGGAAAVSGAKQGFRIPGLPSAAHLGIFIRDASLDWTDEKSGGSGVVDHLSFKLEDLSLSETARAALWGDLDARSPGGSVAQGAFKLEASLTPGLSPDRSGLVRLEIQLSGDFSRLDIRVPGKFQKAAGIPASLEAKATLSDSQWRLEEFSIGLRESSLRLSGAFVPSADSISSAIVDFRISEGRIDLEELAALLPSIPIRELQGRASLSGTVSGPTDRLGYSIKLNLSELRFQSPWFQGKPTFALNLDISSDQIERLQASLQAPGSDVQLTGKMISFSAPRGELSLSSSALDLDQLLAVSHEVATPPSPVAPGSGVTAAATPRETGPIQSVPGAEDRDDRDSWIARNPTPDWIRRASAQIDINIESLKSKGVVLESVAGKAAVRNLSVSLQKLAFTLFGGTGVLDAAVDLGAAHPVYRFSLQIRDLDLQRAAAARTSMAETPLAGVARFSLEGSGSNLTSQSALQDLKARGSFEVRSARFGMSDLSRVVADGVNAAITGIGAKVPALAALKLEPPSSKEGIRYESVSTSFSIADGKLKMPDFQAQSQAGHGLDARGAMELALKSEHTLGGRLEIIDTHNFMHAQELSVEVAGVRVDNLLAVGRGPVKLPVSVGCTISSPCFSYAEAPEYLGRIALEKMERAAGKKLRGGLKAAAEGGIKELEKKASPGLKKTLKGLKDLLKK